MKLEVGKVYFDGRGEKHRIACYRDGWYVDDSNLHFFADGAFVPAVNGPSLHNLVAEAPVETKPNPIPHADLIRAVLDGRVVQFKSPVPTDSWRDMGGDLHTIVAIVNWNDCQFRLKPEPVVCWQPVYKHDAMGPQSTPCTGAARHTKEGAYHARDVDGFPELPPTKILRLELDPDTLDVISARTDAP